jgi:uncharacterized membrane protein SirB2
MAAIEAAMDNEHALFTVSISNVIGPEYLPMVHDVARMVAIQVTIQLMVYLSSPSGQPFFTQDFALLVIYIVLGVMLYWLALRKIVAFA